MTASKKSSTKKSAIMLDRDGVINYERKDYVKSLQEFKFIDNAIEAIKLLSTSGNPIVVITNQSAIGRGLLSKAELERIHEYMIREIEKGGGKIDALYYCPHMPNEGCDCRKPKTRLFKNAESDLNLDLSKSWYVGDKPEDEEAGRRAGCKTIVINSNTPGALLEASKTVLHSIKERESFRPMN